MIIQFDIGTEKLIMFTILMFVLCHVFSCIWILIAYYTFDPDTGEWSNEDNWVVANELQDMTYFQLYVVSFYFTIETVTTVGYGDYGPYNTFERIYLTALFIAGVISFSYATGSLSSIISSADEFEAVETARMMKLAYLKQEYGLKEGLYH